jgi:UMF1 family MFS transporter
MTQAASKRDAATSDWKSPAGWALFQVAKDPYVVLVIIFVFAPYFTSTVLGDPVRGQAQWGRINAYASLFVALTAPVLGAVADAMGRRKPWLLAMVAMMVPGAFALWWVRPGGLGLPVELAAVILGLNAIGLSFSEMLHNSMLPGVAPPGKLGFLSGGALAMSAAAAFLLLCFVLWGFMLPGRVDWPIVPAHPLFGLDAGKYENSRVTAPLTAVWLALLSLPLFIFTREPPAARSRIGPAVLQSFGRIWTTVRSLRRCRNVAVFLAARMAFNDGATALILFTGVFAAGVFHWDALALTAFAVLLQPASVLFSLVAGWLDDRLGAKTTLIILICGMIVGNMASVSMSPTHMLFFIPCDPAAPPLWSLPLFRTAPELAFLGSALLQAGCVTGAAVSARTLMARIAPQEKLSEFFGLAALSGTATAFIGPLLVAAFTAGFHSQHVGFASASLLLLAGMAGLAFVREKPASE